MVCKWYNGLNHKLDKGKKAREKLTPDNGGIESNDLSENGESETKELVSTARVEIKGYKTKEQ